MSDLYPKHIEPLIDILIDAVATRISILIAMRDEKGHLPHTAEEVFQIARNIIEENLISKMPAWDDTYSINGVKVGQTKDAVKRMIDDIVHERQFFLHGPESEPGQAGCTCRDCTTEDPETPGYTAQ